MNRLRKCQRCKQPFPVPETGRPAKYCSQTCRQMDYQKRKAASNAAAVVQTNTNEWYTPREYIDAARRVLGGFDLDPASCEEANRTVQAAQFYSECTLPCGGKDWCTHDGMAQTWKGRIWLNPPYGRLAGDFVVRLAQQYDAGNVAAAITLVNAHCTDTAWFRPLWAHTLCFTYGRLNFGAGTTKRGGSTHGSVFAYLGPDPAAFAAEFARYGAVVTRYA